MERPRVVIVDDEPPAREKLRAFLERDGRVALAGEAGNGVGAIEVIEREHPDLVFLDIQMPELDGFGVIAGLEMEPPPRVVFVTAYDEHAVRAFEVRALDYLLKPVDRERFTRALDRALEEIQGDGPPDAADRLRDVVRDLPADARPLERFLVRQRGRMFLVPAAEVDWIGAAGNYVEIHSGGEQHLVRGTLTDMEQRLDAARFARIHRSAMVNVSRIRELRPWSHGDLQLVLDDGTELRLSRRYRDRIPGTYGL